MESFRSFITAAQQTKKCPEGYRFDKKLQVCVPIGVTRYYPYFGGKNGNGQNDQQSRLMIPKNSILVLAPNHC